MFLPFISVAAWGISTILGSERNYAANRQFRDSSLTLLRDKENQELRQIQETQAIIRLQAARQGIDLTKNKSLVSAVEGGQLSRFDTEQRQRRNNTEQAIYQAERRSRNDFYSSIWGIATSNTKDISSFLGQEYNIGKKERQDPRRQYSASLQQNQKNDMDLSITDPNYKEML